MPVVFRTSVLLVLFVATSSAFQGRRKMVSFHGRVTVAARRSVGGGMHQFSERPPDPNTFLKEGQLEEKAQMVGYTLIVPVH
jgi:hypothetical protein